MSDTLISLYIGCAFRSASSLKWPYLYVQGPPRLRAIVPWSIRSCGRLTKPTSSSLRQHWPPHPATVQPVHRWRQSLSCSWSPGLEQSATGGHISVITGHISQASEDSSVHRVTFEHTTIVTDLTSVSGPCSKFLFRPL